LVKALSGSPRPAGTDVHDSAGLDDVVVGILEEALNPDLTAKEQEQAFVEVIIMVMGLMPPDK
jgi:hypothetical protein